MKKSTVVAIILLSAIGGYMLNSIVSCDVSCEQARTERKAEERKIAESKATEREANQKRLAEIEANKTPEQKAFELQEKQVEAARKIADAQETQAAMSVLNLLLK